MTILFNVTDAVGSASNHGITRTERKLAAALADRADVEFVAMQRGVLWHAPKDAVVGRLHPVEERRVPVVERYGIDPARDSHPTLGTVVARRVRRRRTAAGDGSIGVAPWRLGSDQTLVSVGLDWVHGTLAEAERLVFGHGGRFVGCCYDTIPIDHPEWIHPPEPDRFVRHFTRLARTAASIMCISRSSQRDLVRLLPSLHEQRAPLLRLGADAAMAPGASELAWVDEHLGDEPFAIYCATIDRRKNHTLLYRAMKEMGRRRVSGRLVFVGMVGSGVGDLVDTMRHDRSIAGRIVHVTSCDDAHLAALYRRARFAVYPSLYEGWGLGVTEAMAHGTPCIVASGSSLGEAGLGVCPELNPLRTGEWAELLSAYFHEAPTLPAVDLPTWEAAALDLLRYAAA